MAPLGTECTIENNNNHLYLNIDAKFTMENNNNDNGCPPPSTTVQIHHWPVTLSTNYSSKPIVVQHYDIRLVDSISGQISSLYNLCPPGNNHYIYTRARQICYSCLSFTINGTRQRHFILHAGDVVFAKPAVSEKTSKMLQIARAQTRGTKNEGCIHRSRHS